MRSLIDRGASHDVQNRKGWTPRMYSYSHAAEQYFLTLIKMDDNKRRVVMMGLDRERAATPVLGRTTPYEQVTTARPRASSGS